MADEPAVELTPTESAAKAIRDKAAANAGDGMASFTHGALNVARSNPLQSLEVADRLELREMRKSRGVFVDLGRLN